MKGQYANELAEGARVSSQFALRGKELRAAKSGQAYLSLQLADKTGCIPAVFFQPSPEACAIPVGSVVDAGGVVTTFRGVKRVSLDSVRPAGSWAPEDLMASSPRSRDDLIDQFREIVGSIRDSVLRALLKRVFGDRGFFDRFARCPGSQSYHHAYLGGLLEHTVSVGRLCQNVCDQYERVDRELLVAAALVHDIGKTDELAFDTSIEYADRGRLIGHVMLGALRIHDAIGRLPAGPESQRLSRLEHAVLSHHGELEWGSPKRPSTLEALLLHHVDNLDAKAAGFSSFVAGATRTDEAWTDSSNLFRRPLYAPRPVEDDRPHTAEEDALYSRMTA